MTTPYQSTGLPLFLRCVEPSGLQSEVIPLTIWGSTSGFDGAFSAVSLSLEGAAPNSCLPLFLKVDDFAPASGFLPLYLHSPTPSINSFVPLYLHNEVAEISGVVRLFIQGEGLQPGALPFSGGLQLWLERPTTSMVPLLLLAPGEPASGLVPLSLHGSQPLSGISTLFIHGWDQLQAGVQLFIRGF